MVETDNKLLSEDHLLDSRYQIQSCLNSGPFLNLYHAFDLERKDFCTIRELFPINSIRDSNHFVQFLQLSHQETFRLQHIFIEDAKEYSLILTPEIFPTRAIFNENRTRYHVIAPIKNRRSLEDLWSELPTLPVNLRMNIRQTFIKLLNLFEIYKFTHLQLTPRNIYLDEDFLQLAIMPGARSHLWYSDTTNRHSQILDPFFTHSDCLEKDKKRTSHCDIYSIWKIFLHMFPEKYLGSKIPQNLEELCKPFNHYQPEKLEISKQKTNPKKFECPACNNLLEIIKPLSKNQCPICREGILKHRIFALNACAKCKTGVLHPHLNTSRLQHCPICQTGKLSKKKSFNKNTHVLLCLNCNEGFLEENHQITRLLDRTQKSLSQWRKDAHRSELTHVCDNCDTQFDEKQDGQWEMITFNKTNNKKYLPEEWAHLAVNMDEGCGNFFCNSCHANFDIIQNSITPIHSPSCSSNFFDCYRFQSLDLQNIKWFGMDKQSPSVGLICKGCSTEFDKIDATHLKLIWTKHPLLHAYINEIYSLEQWHNLRV